MESMLPQVRGYNREHVMAEPQRPESRANTIVDQLGTFGCLTDAFLRDI